MHKFKPIVGIVLSHIPNLPLHHIHRFQLPIYLQFLKAVRKVIFTWIRIRLMIAEVNLIWEPIALFLISGTRTICTTISFYKILKYAVKLSVIIGLKHSLYLFPGIVHHIHNLSTAFTIAKMLRLLEVFDKLVFICVVGLLYVILNRIDLTIMLFLQVGNSIVDNVLFLKD